MSDLNYFKGKVCTILTSPTNRHFVDEAQYANTFLGLVDKVDNLGVWVIQLTTKKKSFFTHHSLVGIIEESVRIFDSEEEANALRKQLEAKLPPKNSQQLISVDSLKKLKNNNQDKK